jgi:hypothetical protein
MEEGESTEIGGIASGGYDCAEHGDVDREEEEEEEEGRKRNLGGGCKYTIYQVNLARVRGRLLGLSI